MKIKEAVEKIVHSDLSVDEKIGRLSALTPAELLKLDFKKYKHIRDPARRMQAQAALEICQALVELGQAEIRKRRESEN